MNNNPGHQMDYDKIEVIDKASTDCELRMKELLYILKRKPEINKQLNSKSKYDIKALIIAAYGNFVYRNVTKLIKFYVTRKVSFKFLQNLIKILMQQKCAIISKLKSFSMVKYF